MKCVVRHDASADEILQILDAAITVIRSSRDKQVSAAQDFLKIFQRQVLCASDSEHTKFDDKGYDIDNVYKITLKSLGKDSPEYVDMGDRTETANLDDGKTLMARIRKSPYVEIAAFSSNALPYQFSYAGNQLDVQDKGDSVFYMGNLRMASPEMSSNLGRKVS